MTVKTEMDLALEALERIAQHERECGERWGEAVLTVMQPDGKSWHGLLLL
jgi:hypothetical protein